MARPRKSSAAMEASGSFDRDPARRRVDPKADGNLGKPPKHLTAERAKIWRELVKTMPEGVGAAADRIAFEVLVSLADKFRNSDRGLSSSELTNFTSLLGKFGLTPASRSNVAIPVSTKAGSNPFEEFTE